ncbi:MAG: glycosyltransferase family 2 protein, partial [Bradymonadaceae bacterium]
GRSDDPHLDTWRDGWRHLRFLLLYSPRWLFLIPGLLLMLAGLGLLGGFYFGQLSVGPITFSGVHSMMYAA